MPRRCSPPSVVSRMTRALLTIRSGDSVSAIHCPKLAGQWLDRIYHRSHGRQHDQQAHADQQANIPHWSPYSTDNSSAGRWTDVSGTSSNEETQRSTDYGTDDGSTAHRTCTSGMSKAKEKKRANIPVPGDKTDLGKRINNDKQHAKMARTSCAMPVTTSPARCEPLPAQDSPLTSPPASTSSEDKMQSPWVHSGRCRPLGSRFARERRGRIA